MGVATGIVGAGLGITQSIMGAVQAKEAREALENIERQPLNNVAENMRVSTLGADLQREENARLAATQIDALRGGGSRAIIGGSGRVQEGSMRMNREIGANLDEQQVAIDRLYAQDQANIRGMKENRENADISALSSQYTAGRQGMFDGMSNVLRGGAMAFGAANNDNNNGGGFYKDYFGNKLNDSSDFSSGIGFEPSDLKL